MDELAQLKAEYEAAKVQFTQSGRTFTELQDVGMRYTNALEQRDAQQREVLDELAAWVGYGDWHYASVELACKVRAILGERDYLPKYDCDDAATALGADGGTE